MRDLRVPALRLALLLLFGAVLTNCATSGSTYRRSEAVPTTSAAAEKALNKVTPGATRSTPRGARSGGELAVASVQPSSETALTEDSVISVVFDYRISNMQREFKYGIAPFFADLHGSGATFCALNDLTAALHVTEPRGRVSLQYPIRAEWRGGRLALPPLVWFCLVEQSRSSQRVLVEVGPFSFR